MRDIRTSGLMSGDGKRGGAVAPVLAPILDSTGILRRTSARTPTWQPGYPGSGRSTDAGTAQWVPLNRAGGPAAGRPDHDETARFGLGGSQPAFEAAAALPPLRAVAPNLPNRRGLN